MSGNLKVRTSLQNRALHKYFSLLAEALNDSGRSIQTTLRHDVEIPWSSGSVKELLWRPIQEAMTEKQSTTTLDRMEIGQIYEVLNLHLGQKLGIHVPFPSEETQHQ